MPGRLPTRQEGEPCRHFARANLRRRPSDPNRYDYKLTAAAAIDDSRTRWQLADDQLLCFHTRQFVTDCRSTLIR